MAFISPDARRVHQARMQELAKYLRTHGPTRRNQLIRHFGRRFYESQASRYATLDDMHLSAFLLIDDAVVEKVLCKTGPTFRKVISLTNQPN